MIKVLHTGDIHLDSPFSGLSPDRAELRRAELRSAFTSMMTYARTGDIDIVLVTGDLFESRYITRETAELVTGEFSRVGCPVIVSPGNHDPYTHGSIWEKIKMPDNVKVFSSDVLQCFSFPELNTDVYGYAFVSGEMTSVPLASASVADRGRINLICAHADMTSPLSHSAPLSKDVLASFGADYAALGHIHNADNYRGEAGSCSYAYCGCLVGRSFDECGDKGALVVTVDKDSDSAKAAVRTMKFSRRRYEDISVDVTGAATSREVTDKIEDAISGADDETAVRVRIYGVTIPRLSFLRYCRSVSGCSRSRSGRPAARRCGLPRGRSVRAGRILQDDKAEARERGRAGARGGAAGAAVRYGGYRRRKHFGYLRRRI
ncbi:MAG: metallophosphoesterase family protein [Lachnospiraceae bacterium]